MITMPMCHTNKNIYTFILHLHGINPYDKHNVYGQILFVPYHMDNFAKPIYLYEADIFADIFLTLTRLIY
jgi:hypothetical protein